MREKEKEKDIEREREVVRENITKCNAFEINFRHVTFN